MRRKNVNGGGNGRHYEESSGVKIGDTAATYFVPSFSIRRHVSRDSEAELEFMQQQVRKRLGNRFSVASPDQLTLKVISQKALIFRMREANLHPSPEDMRSLAFNICDGLFDRLQRAPSPLRVPLGALGLFGYKNQALGINVEGWRGHRARYASHDIDGSMTPHGTLVSESQFCLDSIANALDDTNLNTTGILSTPHVTIARHAKDIREGTLREVQHELSDILPREIEMGDPVIEFKASRADDPEVLRVRNAWASLGEF